jgi:hypothetical protein
MSGEEAQAGAPRPLEQAAGAGNPTAVLPALSPVLTPNRPSPHHATHRATLRHMGDGNASQDYRGALPLTGV